MNYKRKVIIMKKNKAVFTFFAFMLFSTLFSLQSFADSLPTHVEIKEALKSIVGEENGGFGLNMWATVVDRDGVVKAVVFSGNDRGDQWPYYLRTKSKYCECLQSSRTCVIYRKSIWNNPTAWQLIRLAA